MATLSARHFSIAYRGLLSAPGWGGKARFLRHAAAQGLFLLIRKELARGTGPLGTIDPDLALIDAITTATDIETMAMRTLPARLDPAAPTRVNLLTPILSASQFFGGYIAYAQFAAALQRAGAQIRFIATDAMDGNKAAIVKACRTEFPALAEVFEASEFTSAVEAGAAPIAFSVHDLVVAFNCAGAAMAHQLSQALFWGRPFLFFIQDEEGIFHANDSYRAWKQSVYALPHVPIFNSHWLQSHFVQSGFGPAARGEPHQAFRHALEALPPPSPKELAGRGQRKFLFLARPERNNARNLFELGLVALKRAVARGAFPPILWRLHAIGSKAYAPIDLGSGRKLEFIGKLPFEAYQQALPTYDAGMVLMFSPHPSVPNLQLAASGVPTVTTAYANRPAAAMEQAAPNLIVRTPALEPLADGLLEAERRALDFDQRHADATFPWPREWRDSFSPDWIAALKTIVRDTSGAAVEADVFRADP